MLIYTHFWHNLYDKRSIEAFSPVEKYSFRKLRKKFTFILVLFRENVMKMQFRILKDQTLRKSRENSFAPISNGFDSSQRENICKYSPLPLSDYWYIYTRIYAFLGLHSLCDSNIHETSVSKLNHDTKTFENALKILENDTKYWDKELKMPGEKTKIL